MIESGHYGAKEVETQIIELANLWRKLNEATLNRGEGLREALALVEFNREADMAASWIEEKVRDQALIDLAVIHTVHVLAVFRAWLRRKKRLAAIWSIARCCSESLTILRKNFQLMQRVWSESTNWQTN